MIGHGGVAICGDCARLAVELSSVPEQPPTGDLLLTGISSLQTMDPRHGGLLGSIEGAAVAIRNGRFTWVGRQRALPDRYRDYPEIDCDNSMVAPGFVDAHRHLEAGDLDDLESLTTLLTDQLGESLEQGATTVEVRSWGASGPEEEITALAAIRAAGEALPTDVIPSFVVGTVPPVRGSGYQHMLESVLIPTASRVASYLDVVVGAPLSTTQAREVIDHGRRHGLAPRVHVDDTDALEVALDCQVVSVDGMVGLEEAATVVAESGSVMVSVPIATWVTARPDPARSMWEAGAIVALGSGCQVAKVPNMPMTMAVAVHHGGLTPEQALWSATRGGALAIEEREKGLVTPGAVADLVVLGPISVSDLVTEPGSDPVLRVVKDGVPLGA
ncbi:imidazolonepropionase [soil metagenome]